MSAATHGKFIAGDVVEWSPQDRHCREGTAIALETHGGQIKLFDTFWDGYEDHVLTDAEELTAEVLFNLNDYDEIDRYKRESQTWSKYAPEDRQRVTSQHGLQTRWYVRKGASEHWPTQIRNAEDAVAKCVAAVESAERHLRWAREDLARVEEAAAAAGVVL